MLGSQVVSLADIRIQVIELIHLDGILFNGIAVVFESGLDVLPLPMPNCVVLEEEGLAPSIRLSQQQLRLVDPVNWTVSRDLETGQVGKSRHEVDGSKDRVGRPARRDLPRPAHDAGHAVAAFIRGALAIA